MRLRVGAGAESKRLVLSAALWDSTSVLLPAIMLAGDFEVEVVGLDAKVISVQDLGGGFARVTFDKEIRPGVKEVSCAPLADVAIYQPVVARDTLGRRIDAGFVEGVNQMRATPMLALSVPEGSLTAGTSVWTPQGSLLGLVDPASNLKSGSSTLIQMVPAQPEPAKASASLTIDEWRKAHAGEGSRKLHAAWFASDGPAAIVRAVRDVLATPGNPPSVSSFWAAPVANALRGQEELDLMLEWWRKVGILSADPVAVLFGVQTLFLRGGDEASEIARLRQVTAEPNCPGESHLALAMALENAGMSEDATRAFETCRTLMHRDIGMSVILTRRSSERGDREGFKKEIVRLATLSGKPAFILSITDQLRKQGATDEAISVLQPVVERFPGNADVLTSLMLCQSTAGKMDDAVKTAELGALRRLKKVEFWLQSMTVVQKAEGKEALDRWTSTWVKNVPSDEAFVARAMYLLSDKKAQQAYEVLAPGGEPRAECSSMPYAEWYMFACIQAGKSAEGLMKARKFRETFPSSAKVCWQLASMEMACGYNTRAEETVQSGLKSHANDPMLLYTGCFSGWLNGDREMLAVRLAQLQRVAPELAREVESTTAK